MSTESVGCTSESTRSECLQEKRRIQTDDRWHYSEFCLRADVLMFTFKDFICCKSRRQDFSLLCHSDLLLILSSYLERWSHGCDEHLCKVCGADCPCHEAWLDQSDLRARGNKWWDLTQLSSIIRGKYDQTIMIKSSGLSGGCQRLSFPLPSQLAADSESLIGSPLEMPPSMAS